MGITHILFRRFESFQALLIGALFLLVLGPVNGIASTIIPSDADIQVFNAQESGVDVLRVSPPNTAGISINNFSTFVVDSKPLRLINVAGLVDSDDQSDLVEVRPAELIVIVADNIDIRSNIEILGSATDVIFLSTNSSGSINCDYCSFDNVLRLSLITAIPDIAVTESITNIGGLTPSTTSAISISNLTAPGSIGVDVLTGKLFLDGTVDIHQRVLKDPMGGYTNDINGDVVLGTGSLGLILGPITWDYEEDRILSAQLFDGSHNLAGTVYSSSLKISAAGDLNVNTVVDTRTDILSSVNYKNTVHIPRENINIQTFADGELRIDGTQTSNGGIQFNSMGGLYLESSATHISGLDVELIAKNALVNVATIEGQNVSVAGNSVINEGELSALYSLEVWGQGQVSNQYGGLIKADIVKLMSETQVVRNGSRTPYISREFEQDHLLNIFGSNYIEQLDPTKLGTFYALNVPVSTASDSAIMPADSSAHIISNVLQIKAAAFENINPYYEKIDSENSISLQQEYFNQVSVSSESYMGISTSAYVVNSSAVMVVNNESGLLEIHTSLFSNERYRTLSVLEREESSTGTMPTEPCTNQLGCWDGQSESVSFRTKTVAYSPPGGVVFMGDSNVKAGHHFVNNPAYIEVFGDALFDTPTISVLGFESIAVKRTDFYIHGGFILNLPFIQDPASLDSLFFVGGDLQANASTGWFRNHNPLDGFINQAATNLINENFAFVEEGGSRGSTGGIFDLQLSAQNGLVQFDIDSAKETGVLEINWSEDIYVHPLFIDLFGSTPGDPTYEETRTGSGSFSLYDELTKLYELVKNTIVEFFDELDWWNA